MKIKTKYYIDYIYDNPSGHNFYYQLVRTSDNAIIYANDKLDNVFFHCKISEIDMDDVTIL